MAKFLVSTAAGGTFVREPSCTEKPERHVCSLLRPTDKFRQTTIVFDLFGNSQLAVY